MSKQNWGNGLIDMYVCCGERNVAYLLASGSDDGCFKVWDLRKFQQQEPLARFQWHKGEWLFDKREAWSSCWPTSPSVIRITRMRRHQTDSGASLCPL